MRTPTHDELCKVAYHYWEERGRPDGSPEVDWQRAEEELRRLAEQEAHSSAGASASAHDAPPTAR
jgi:hypothetical protein